MRSTFLYSLVAASAALALAGCGGGSDYVPPSTPAPAPAPVNAAPTADAGTSQSVVTGATVTLDGSKSSDADGDKLTYAWTLTSKPAGSAATLTGLTSPNPTFVADVTGDYVASLVVSDGNLDSAASTVTITAGTVVGFGTVPSLLPPHVSSWGIEALGMKGIGDHVELAADSPHTLDSVNVVMDSWACQTGTWWQGTCDSAPGSTFDWPVTLTIFDSDGAQIAEKTQTFAMRFRPSADPACPDPANSKNALGYKASDGSCYEGVAFEITFDMASLKLALPDAFSYEISYNTTTYGPNPIGGGSPTQPYDSLNIGNTTAAPSVGSYRTVTYTGANQTKWPAGHLVWDYATTSNKAPDQTRGVMAQFEMVNP